MSTKSEAIATRKLNLAQEFAALEKKGQKLYSDSEKILADLDNGIAQKELEVTQEKAKLDAKLEKHTVMIQKKLDELSSNLDKAELEFKKFKVDLDENKMKAKTTHEREMEQLKYDQTIAKRDNDAKFVTAMMKQFSQTAVDNAELTELKLTKTNYDKDVNGLKKALTVAKADQKKAEVTVKEVEDAKTSQQTLLNFQLDTANKTIASQEARIKELETQVKDFPSQLIKAAEAAKTTITTTGK